VDQRSQEEANGWLLFDEMIVGSQGGGEYTTVGGLPGSVASLEPLSALPAGTDLVQLFANRMYRTHGIPEMISKSSSTEGLAGRKLRVLITDNKRYTPDDRTSLKKYTGTVQGSVNFDAMVQISSVNIDDREHEHEEGASATQPKLDAVTMLNQRSDIEAYYINWEKYFPLSRQLRVIRDADIHMTATGTALFFGVFLQDGAVNINLGEMHTGSPGTFPTWGEEFLSSSNPRIRAIYRNVSRLLGGPVTAEEIADLVDEAAMMIRSGFPIPLSKPEENLSPIGKVLYKLVSEDRPSLQGARGYTATDGGFDCHIHGRSHQMDPAPLVLGFTNASQCPG